MHGPAETNLAHGKGRTVMGGESGKMWPTLTSKKKPMQRDPPKAISMVQYIVAEGNRKVTTQFHETGKSQEGPEMRPRDMKYDAKIASPGLVKITKISGVAFGESNCVHKWWRQAAARRLGRRK